MLEAVVVVVAMLIEDSVDTVAEEGIVRILNRLD
jgi:hypothetical protein